MAVVPESLFKYTKLKWAMQILQTGLIKFTPPNELNDPFDQYLRVEPTDEDIERYAKAMFNEYFAFGKLGTGPYQKLLKEHFDPMQEHVRTSIASKGEEIPRKLYEDHCKKYGLLCLTENNSSLLMWGHYADAHKGCALELSLEGKEMDHTFAGKVIYDKERPVFRLDEKAAWVFTKSLEWHYESEWRIIAKLSQLKHRLNEDKLSIYEAALPENSVVGIYLGVWTSEKEIQLLKEAAANCDNQKGIKFFKARLNEKCFALNFEPLP